ncbi:hypothetical protein Glove_258g54 [Diversispora epigaea]|uniref:Uncharacterized protein n=1 Tax=Diversispora epigaea TaxID=1348612 RepID=A0A397I8T3_9GLOM|nr:hypothetical protein Glove_258g54 [Diversispora epigaea]
MAEDREKVLKLMQLGLFRLRQKLKQQKVDENSIINAETFGIIVYNQFEEFNIPDNSSQLVQLKDVIKTIFCFKQRVVNPHHLVQSLFSGKLRFQRRPKNTDEMLLKHHHESSKPDVRMSKNMNWPFDLEY